MESVEGKNLILSLGKGVLIAFVFTLITLFVFACLLYFTDLTEDTIKPVIITITGISILLGSSIGTRKFRKNGIFSGALIGGTYIISLYLISSIISASFKLNLSSIIIIITGMIAGAFGGIIGVNIKN